MAWLGELQVSLGVKVRMKCSEGNHKGKQHGALACKGLSFLTQDIFIVLVLRKNVNFVKFSIYSRLCTFTYFIAISNDSWFKGIIVNIV